MEWRRWGLVLLFVAGLGGLALVGRQLDLAEGRPPAAQPAAPIGSLTVATVPPPVIPEPLRRPLRLPGLRGDGSCPVTPAAGPPVHRARTAVAMTLGDGPVYPVLLRNLESGGLDRTAAVYWDAPRPLGGVAIVRGHMLGRPQNPVRFQDDFRGLDVVSVLVLDPAVAKRTGRQGLWWRTSLSVGVGCYGLQIDGPGFSEVLVVEFGRARLPGGHRPGSRSGRL